MKAGRAALVAAALAARVSLAAEGEPAPGPAPLVLLVQGDAVAGSKPAPGAVDPPSGAALRLRRLRAGEDVRASVLRVRLVLEAQATDLPYAGIEGGRLPGGGAVRLTDGFLAFIPHRAFEIDVGSERVPFSLSRQVEEADLRLPERAAIVAAQTPDFRAGVALAGDLGLLQYRGAVMAAAPELARTFSGGALAALRVAAEPIGPMGVAPWLRRPQSEADPWYAWWRFSAGASIIYGTLLEPRTLALGADAQLQWRRFTASGEYLFLHAPTGDRQGAVLEPGFFVLPDRLELALRAAWSRSPLEGEAGAAGAGFTLYTHGGHLRFQAGFEKRRDSSGWALARATLTL